MSIGTNPVGPDLPGAVDPVGVVVLLISYGILWVIWTVLIKPLVDTPGHRGQPGSSFPELVLVGLAIAYLIDWWRRHRPEIENEDD